MKRITVEGREIRKKFKLRYLKKKSTTNGKNINDDTNKKSCIEITIQ